MLIVPPAMKLESGILMWRRPRTRFERKASCQYGIIGDPWAQCKRAIYSPSRWPISAADNRQALMIFGVIRGDVEQPNGFDSGIGCKDAGDNSPSRGF